MDNVSPSVNAAEAPTGNSSTSAAVAPVTVAAASVGSGSSVKRPRSEEDKSEGREKRQRSESAFAPGTAVSSVEAPAKSGPESGKLSGKSGSGTKSTPPKPSDVKKLSPRSSPRTLPVDPDEERPLDLIAIRQFEYDQVANFGPSQQKRYEHYRRSDLKKEKVKKVCVALNPSLAKASDQFLIAVKGLAKVFVGDVVEMALEVKAQLGDTGALQPKHLREAYRRLRRDGEIPSSDARPSALR